MSLVDHDELAEMRAAHEQRQGTLAAEAQEREAAVREAVQQKLDERAAFDAELSKQWRPPAD